MKNKLLWVILTACSLGAQAFGASSAGDAPTGTLTSTPDTTYIGAGMSISFSASNLADVDCIDGKSEDDDTPTSYKITASNNATPEESTTSPAVITFPDTAGTVNIDLKVDDVGSIADDGGFITVATKAITVAVPDKAESYSPFSTTITSPVYGAQYGLQVVDTNGKAFKVPGLPALEDADVGYQRFINGTPVGNPSFDYRRKANLANLSASGQFTDPIGLTLNDAIQLASTYDDPTEVTFKIRIATSKHSYYVNLPSPINAWHLSGDFAWSSFLQLVKSNNQWQYNSHGY